MTSSPGAEGEAMYGWARDLFPMTRSITGPGVRETLAYLQQLVPSLRVLEVASGTRVFDWCVPDEWTIRDAYIADESGTRIVDFRQSNLHVVGYSVPVDAWMSRAELDAHLHSLPELPDAIPYVTSYYERYWGFCLSHRQRVELADAAYHVVIDSTLAPGVMNAGEIVLPGSSRKEVLLSTNICHPSLANNELSGPVVATALARWISALPDRRYTYRILFLPETIGSIWYLCNNAEHLKRHVIAGYVLACVGDDRSYSYLASRDGDTLADRIALRTLIRRGAGFRRYTFLDRGSDERQYCSPHFDLPVCSVMRTKYGEYPEYHTSLDDLSLISSTGLQGAFDVLRECISTLEGNSLWQATTPCEPQLGKRGLYPQRSTRNVASASRAMLDVLAYADGTRDSTDIATATHLGVEQCEAMLAQLETLGLVSVVT